MWFVNFLQNLFKPLGFRSLEKAAAHKRSQPYFQLTSAKEILPPGIDPAHIDKSAVFKQVFQQRLSESVSFGHLDLPCWKTSRRFNNHTTLKQKKNVKCWHVHTSPSRNAFHWLTVKVAQFSWSPIQTKDNHYHPAAALWCFISTSLTGKKTLDKWNHSWYWEVVLMNKIPYNYGDF